SVALLSQGGDSAEMLSLRSAEQSVDDFTLDQAAGNWAVRRRIEKVDKPRAGVQELERGDADGDGAGVRRFLAQMKRLLGENLANLRHFEPEQQSEERFLFRRRNHLADNRQVDRGQEEVRAVADVNRLADIDSLLPLYEDH